MSLRFRVLGSGSTGNATLVEAGETRILIDAGLGPRSLAERLQDAGVDPASLADRLAPTLELLHQLGVHGEALGQLDVRVADPVDDLDRDGGVQVTEHLDHPGLGAIPRVTSFAAQVAL